MTEFEKAVINLMTEIRDELFRQGNAHRQDHYEQTYIITAKYS